MNKRFEYYVKNATFKVEDLFVKFIQENEPVASIKIDALTLEEIYVLLEKKDQEIRHIMGEMSMLRIGLMKRGEKVIP